jgi:hypothetical protein
VLKGLGAREKQLLTAETLEADLDSRKRQLVEAEAAGSKVVKKVGPAGSWGGGRGGAVGWLRRSVLAAPPLATAAGSS